MNLETIEVKVVSRQRIGRCGECVHYQLGWCWYPIKGEEHFTAVRPGWAGCGVFEAKDKKSLTASNEEF